MLVQVHPLHPILASLPCMQVKEAWGARGRNKDTVYIVIIYLSDR